MWQWKVASVGFSAWQSIQRHSCRLFGGKVLDQLEIKLKKTDRSHYEPSYRAMSEKRALDGLVVFTRTEVVPVDFEQLQTEKKKFNEG